MNYKLKIKTAKTMTTANEPKSGTANRELAITRVFNAPRELVFEAWTNPDHLAHWWGPVGFTNTHKEVDIRPGGVWRFTMHGPDGRDYPNRIDFTEVVPPSFLSYKHTGDDGIVSFTVTVKFEAEGEKTRLTMHSLFRSAEELEMLVRENGADKGMIEHLNNLEDQLALMQSGIHPEEELTISRIFDAPIDIVYKAWTQPEQLAKWWGPTGFKILVANLDLRPGGMFLYSMQSPDGQEMWGRFVYKEIEAPTRLVFVNSFTDEKGNIIRAPFSPVWPLEVFNILTFSDYGTKTAISLKGWPLNATLEEHAAFKAMHEGMNQGFKGTFDQLDSHLARLKENVKS
jgi:uncharacterized protein YndB with AHSA1/START domain